MKIDFSLDFFSNIYSDKKISRLLFDNNKIKFEENIEDDAIIVLNYHDDTYIRKAIIERINDIKEVYDRGIQNEEGRKIIYSLFDKGFPDVKYYEKEIKTQDSYKNFNIIKPSDFNEYILKLYNFKNELTKLLSIVKPFEIKSSILSSSELDVLRQFMGNNWNQIDHDLKYMFNAFLDNIFDTNSFNKYLAKVFESSKRNGLFSSVVKRIDAEINKYKNILGFDQDISGEEVLERAISEKGDVLNFLTKRALEDIFPHINFKYNTYNKEIFSKYFNGENSQYSSGIVNIDDIFNDLENHHANDILYSEEKVIIPEISYFLQEKKKDKENKIIKAMDSAVNDLVSDSAELIRDISMYNLIEDDGKEGLLYGYIPGIFYKENLKLINNFFREQRDNIINRVSSVLPPGELHSLTPLIKAFLERYEQIVIKELQENQKYNQGKTDSIKLFDRLKYKNIPINKLNIEVKHDDSSFYYDDNNYKVNLLYNNMEIDSNTIYTSKLNYTYLLYIDNFKSIFTYLITFKDEFYKILNITDLNKLKDYLINIINFLIPKNSSDNISNLLNYNKEITENGAYILEKINSDPNKKTKNEQLTLYNEVLRLIHNFSNEKFTKYLLYSRYLTKLNSVIALEIFTCFANILKTSNFSISLRKIIDKKPKLLPGHIYTDFIKNIINDILKDKFDNHEELDKIFEKLLLTNPSDNIRKLKYVSSLVANYEAISNWIDLAKEKEEDVFSANFSTESFRFRVLGDFDPYHFQVGMDTNCCQTIGGAGESAAIDSFINPKAGVVVLEINKNGFWNLAAQSYFHVFSVMNNAGKEIKGIILDNIEAGRLQSRYEKDRFYPKAYAILGRYLKKKGFDIVGCGTAHTLVMSKNDFMLSSIDFDPRHFEVEENSLEKYTDFNDQSFYDLLKPMFNFEMPNDINSEVKMARLLNLKKDNLKKKSIASLYNLYNILLNSGLKKEAAFIIDIVENIY